MHPENDVAATPTGTPARRTVLTSAAWGVPAVMLATSSPAHATSSGGDPSLLVVNWAAATITNPTDPLAPAFAVVPVGDGSHVFRIAFGLSGETGDVSLRVEGNDLVATLTGFERQAGLAVFASATSTAPGATPPSAGLTVGGMIGSADPNTSDAVMSDPASVPHPARIDSSTGFVEYANVRGLWVAVEDPASVTATLIATGVPAESAPEDFTGPGSVVGVVFIMNQVARARQELRISNTWLLPT